MHHLADLTALNNQSCLHTLTCVNEVVVYGAHCEQRRNGDMILVDVAVGEDDIVVAFVHALLCIVTELVEGFA